uniref:Uncharacterized protein n=1 Tax=Arundo donax TaxID=35708 RepID=A0A0A9DEU3_ARUDO
MMLMSLPKKMKKTGTEAPCAHAPSEPTTISTQSHRSANENSFRNGTFAASSAFFFPTSPPPLSWPAPCTNELMLSACRPPPRSTETAA